MLVVLVSGLRETEGRTQVTHTHTQHTQSEVKLASGGFRTDGPIKSSLFGEALGQLCLTLIVTFTHLCLLIRIKTNVRSFLFVSNDLHGRLIRVGAGQRGL